jgi:hypothetical protein
MLFAEEILETPLYGRRHDKWTVLN